MHARKEDSFYPENHQFNLLKVPSSLDDIDELYKQKECYEKIYNIKFIDLGAFVSYIVAEQLHDPEA